MAVLWKWLKVVCLGILEGITEWLPISSTGHLLLLDQFLHLEESRAFKELFFVVIQLGAILAVVCLFWRKMLPFRREGGLVTLQHSVLLLWLKVAVACIPGALVTLLLDEFLERLLKQSAIGEGIPLMPVVIALALILYGILFLLIEGKQRPPRIQNVRDVRFSDALLIGLFQTLSIIPGTSRSGSTIIGALCLGISRTAATEFTFFLALPVMLGYSLLKLIKFGLVFTASQFFLLLLGSAAAFFTSLAVIGALMTYVKKHSFASFGLYRILLGTAVLLHFLL